MTGPVSQSSVPAGAATAADATADDQDLGSASHDADGVPVGQADVEADKRRAEEDAEQD
jgi:hypothetical protein